MLALFSPPLIVPAENDKKYRSSKARSKPLPLPSIHDTPEVDLTVVIPAYNETERMPSMLQSTLAHLKSSDCSAHTYEILIVDDGSTDGTSDLSLKLAVDNPDVDIRVVTLSKNLGKGGAVRHGMLYGRGRRVLMVDADGASRFEDLDLLWAAMDKLVEKEKPAIAVGSRAHLVKTEAVVKVRSLRLGPPINAKYYFYSDHSSEISLCTVYTPSCVSSVSGTSATRSVVSNFSPASQHNKYSHTNIYPLGYLMLKFFYSPNSCVYPWRRCLSSGTKCLEANSMW